MSLSKPTTRAELKELCLRKLGAPVIEINVADEQLDDAIEEALSFWQDYHFDATEKIYLKHLITAEDVVRKWIPIPEAILGIVNMLPISETTSTSNMFDLRYQMRLNDLQSFTSVSALSYTMTMQHLSTLELMFSGVPQFRFQRHQDRLYLDFDWAEHLPLGTWVVLECYRLLLPETVTLTGTGAIANTSNVITGTSTVFDSELIVDDYLTINGAETRITGITSATSINVTTTYAATTTGLTMTQGGFSDLWNDRYLIRYTTALIKKVWGNNSKKFSGVQLPGGVTLNGQQIFDEALLEIQGLEEEMQRMNVLPSNLMVG